MQKFKSLFYNRIFYVAILIVLQLFIFVLTIYLYADYNVNFQRLMIAISIIMVIYVINKKENPSYKLAWSVLILSVPLIGGIAYLLFGGKKIPKALRNDLIKSFNESSQMLPTDPMLVKKIYEFNETIGTEFDYVKNNSYFPYYNNTKTTYFASGEEMIDTYLADLRSAEHFIFIEYFIIKEGKMWNSILDILIDKASKGVDVRVIYDDAGCVTTLPSKYDAFLRSKGIKCSIFNQLKPRLAIKMNNRDHRKITVIDNQIGYTGGINLSDEYINEIERFGYWKDTAIRFEGLATWNVTCMFIQFWNALNTTQLDYDYYKVKPKNVYNDYFTLPFSDSPTDNEEVGRTVHLNMINHAKEYIYIHTPYLVIDYDMSKALQIASKNGVDVRITVPHIPDKKIVFQLTRNHYEDLINAGVKIYEFTPGFLHSKNFVSDDRIALVGTINMDYRSYYMHYECGCLTSDPKTVMDIKKDYLLTLAKSVQITKDDCNKVSIFTRIIRAILNLFAPLM